MPQTLNQLTIFVSGPSNVDAEKTALRTVVEKINGLFEKTRGITLRVVGWPNDLRPGVNSDPQSEIGYQVGTDYDIYVGILGSRFGSETIQAGSGTEEEFDGALSRFRGDSTAIRVLIYFKKEPDEDIFSIDPSQLQKVHDFRQRLGERGVLYRDFRDTGEFTEMVRQHLESLITEEWEDRKWSQKVPSRASDDPAATAQEKPSPGDIYPEDDEPGLLEYTEAYLEASKALGEVMDEITKITEKVGKQILKRTEEIGPITEKLEEQKAIGGSMIQQSLFTKTREIIDHSAENIYEFAIEMAPKVQLFKIHNREFYNNLLSALHIENELGSQETSDSHDREALLGLIRELHDGRRKLVEFQSSINQIPSLTKKIRRSKKQAALILGEFIAELSSSTTKAGEVLKEIG